MKSAPVFLKNVLANNPEAIALTGALTSALTYAELDRWSSNIAADLDRFCPPGVTIGLLAPSSVEFAVGLLAIWKLGAIAVPLQPAHPLTELRYIREDAQLKIILTHHQCLSLAEDISSQDPCRLIRLDRRMAEVDFVNRGVDERDGSLIVYTSGTTSRPKGALSSFRALDARVKSLLQAWRWSSNDRTLNVLPLHHVHGLINIVCCSLAAGASCEMAERFSPELVWDRIATDSLSVFMAVPTIYSRLIAYWKSQPPEIQSRLSDSARRLRLMVSGSAALPRPIFEDWLMITGHRLLERYGMTEIGMALSNPYIGERKIGMVGAPLPGVDVRLVTADENLITEPHQPGEIQVRGPVLFSGYWGQPRLTAEAFSGEWFKTGDIAERDRDGDYRILGRASQDIIKSGGYKISALEIESVLLEHPDLLEVAVVGVADAEWGERVAAVYIAKPESSVSDLSLTTWAKPRLAHYKVPTIWKKTTSLPRNAMGKVIKPDVRQLLLSVSRSQSQ